MSQINQLINKSTREEILKRLGKIMDIDNIKLKPARKVHFCVVYNNKRTGLEHYKEYIKRLFKGEKIKGKGGKDVYLVFGYGTLLGMKYVITPNKKYTQYLIYNIVILSGEDSSSLWGTYHEAWIKLGKWVKDNRIVTKEQVVFT